MEKIAIFAHGFNVHDRGKGTTDRLIPYFKEAGYQCIEKDTSWRFLIGARFLTPKYAKGLAEYVNDYKKFFPEALIIFIGHSDGCNMGNQAAHLGAEFDQMFYVNPALDSDSPLAPQVKQCVVLHNRKDWATKVAKYLPWHPWGSMGNVGYEGDDDRYINWNTEDVYVGHSGLFKDQSILNYYASRMVTNSEINSGKTND